MVTTEEKAREAYEKWMKGLTEAVGVERLEEVWALFPEFIFEELDKVGEIEAQEWDLGKVKEYLYECRVEDKGNPTIQRTFAGKPFRDEKVMIKCTGGYGTTENHEWFKHMPEEMKQLLIHNGTWKKWARAMVKQGVLTKEEFRKMIRSAFIMTPGSYEEKE